MEQKGNQANKKISAKFKKAIIAAVDDLPTTDGWRNVIPLTNHQYMYRLRVGRFRVFFDLEQNQVKIYPIPEV